MARLIFLPRGNATLTRRAKKNSPLSAVVLKFNRRRKRYERQEKAAARRMECDAKPVREMTELILTEYPPVRPKKRSESLCTQRNVEVTGSAALQLGEHFRPKRIELAVRGWIRHQHTDDNLLLMRGVERKTAREQIDGSVSSQLRRWQGCDASSR